jgi:hypothetical protein
VTTYTITYLQEVQHAIDAPTMKDAAAKAARYAAERSLIVLSVYEGQHVKRPDPRAAG